MGRLWQRQLPRYPDTGARTGYLAITVLATIILYYELYVQGAVATTIIRTYHFTFTQFVFVLVIGNAVGAFAALFAGLADRWGRANLVVGGLLVTGAVTAFGLPHAGDKTAYTILYALLTLVEGVALVATPALIRDFSPQVGRGTAMGFWTLGPVIGSLIVTEVSSHTLSSHPDWRYQFYVAGAVGLAVWVIALLGLRELSPQLRDQLMVTMRDRALVEARAAGIDPDKALEGSWRQMVRPDIVLPAFAISVFLIFYYMLVAFIVVYFVTVFGYTEARTNSLANWYWIANAIGLVTIGILSDRIRVRKPFMVVGTLVSAAGVGWFASVATSHHTGYYTFAWFFVLIAAFGGMAYVAWMAAFTETVEKHNPAATATGLAVWGWIIRAVVTVSFAILTFVVPATTTLVDQGTRAQAIAKAYPTQVRVLQTVDQQTLGALAVNPNNALAQVKAVSELSGVPEADVGRAAALDAQYHLSTLPPAQALQILSRLPAADAQLLVTDGPKLQAAQASLLSLQKFPTSDLAFLAKNGDKITKAQKHNPHQWQHWWWVCFAGQLMLLPFIFLLTGRWSPRRAREDELEHERRVEAELAALAPGRA